MEINDLKEPELSDHCKSEETFEMSTKQVTAWQTASQRRDECRRRSNERNRKRENKKEGNRDLNLITSAQTDKAVHVMTLICFWSGAPHKERNGAFLLVSAVKHSAPHLVSRLVKEDVARLRVL